VLSYDAGFIDAYLNGVRLDQTDFTASSGTSFVLASGAVAGDEINIVCFGTFVVASMNGTDLINGTVSANKLASGVAVSNLGYTPVNKAGDTIAGALTISQANSGGIAALTFSQDESTIQGPASNTQIRMGGNLVLGGANLVTVNVGGVGRLVADSSGNFKFNSGYGSVETAYGCRVWVCIKGDSTPASIIGSGGVSSVTDTNVGSYRINFLATMPDVNYACVMGFQRITGSGDLSNEGFSRGTTSTAVEFFSGGSVADPQRFDVAIFR
jgi:hypothetical protein